jgi:hypothetical protein
MISVKKCQKSIFQFILHVMHDFHSYSFKSRIKVALSIAILIQHLYFIHSILDVSQLLNLCNHIIIIVLVCR